MCELEFSTENNAVRHLGRKLYSTIPPALAELVANSYDGYAEHCFITFNEDSYVVADDGIGMDLSQLQAHYASIGQQKSETPIPDGMVRRRPMGKKGIGKLAAFSLGDTYAVYTKTRESNHWLSFFLKYNEMLKEENNQKYKVEVSYLEELPDELADYACYEQGFIVRITDLRRKPDNNNTTRSLEKQLSRRFYVQQQGINFKITVQNEEVDLSGQYLYDHVVCANYVNYDDVNINHMFRKHCGDYEDVAQFTQFKPDNTRIISQEDFISLTEKKHVRGWVGALDKPRTKGNLVMGSILVYINGKVADEDFLKNNNDAQIGNQYVVGELFADYLNDDAEDPITSSRQGLDESDSQVALLLLLARAMRSKAIAQWNAAKERQTRKQLPSMIRDNEKYKTWYANLTQDQKKFHTKLIKNLGVTLDNRDEDEAQSEEETVAIMNSFIMLTESEETRRLGERLSSLESNSSELFTLIGKYFGEVATQEKIQQANIISQRLLAITKLKNLMQDPSVLEKTFQNHLMKNPWLINPYWSQSDKSQGEITYSSEEFCRLYKEQSEDYKRQFIDIYVEVAGEKYPIIVELKRNNATGYAKTDAYKLQEQIDNYRLAIVQRMNDSQQREIQGHITDIPAYAIISERTGPKQFKNAIDLGNDMANRLASANIKVLTYRQLVNNAMTEYRQFLKVQEDEKVPYFPIPDTSSDR